MIFSKLSITSCKKSGSVSVFRWKGKRGNGKTFPRAPIRRRYCQDFFICFLRRNSPSRTRTASFLRFIDHTKYIITVARPSLHERSACRRDLYLTTHNTHERQTFMPSAGFEPSIPASNWPQILAVDRLTTWMVHLSRSDGGKSSLQNILVFYETEVSSVQYLKLECSERCNVQLWRTSLLSLESFRRKQTSQFFFSRNRLHILRSLFYRVINATRTSTTHGMVCREVGV